MAILRSRALTGSCEPRPPVRTIKNTIEHHCSTCEESYLICRTYGRAAPGFFGLLGMQMEVVCPFGHREVIDRSVQHLT